MNEPLKTRIHPSDLLTSLLTYYNDHRHNLACMMTTRDIMHSLSTLLPPGEASTFRSFFNSSSLPPERKP